MKKIAIVVTTPMTINSFMKNHIVELAKDFNITVIANTDMADIHKDLPVNVIHLPIVRDISLHNDFRSVFSLYNIIRKNRFDAIHSITPKAGLVSMIAARLANVEHRFHTFTGQVWVTKRGIFRYFLRGIDKIIFSLATGVLIDSPSQKQFLINENVVDDSAVVLGEGSISGVDLKRFSFNPYYREAIRTKYGLDDNAFVFLFLGRLCADKGIEELLAAFKSIQSDANVYLLLVGPDEGGYNKEHFDSFRDENIIACGLTNAPEQYYSASDCLVLPSYREGFGTTVIEAAACGIPCLASNIYGLSDAVVNNSTGLLHQVRNSNELSQHMEVMLEDKDYASTLGRKAFKRAQNIFSAEYLSKQLVQYYYEKLKND